MVLTRKPLGPALLEPQRFSGLKWDKEVCLVFERLCIPSPIQRRRGKGWQPIADECHRMQTIRWKFVRVGGVEATAVTCDVHVAGQYC